MRFRQLEKWYRRYEPFWPIWKYYKFNGLTQKQVALLDQLQSENFAVNSARLYAEYNDWMPPDKMEAICKDVLRRNYPKYKEFVALQFQFYIIRQAIRYGLERFFESPISELELPDVIKSKYLAFGSDTIEGINAKYADKGYCEEKIFSLVSSFSELICKEREPFRYSPIKINCRIDARMNIKYEKRIPANR